MHSRCSCHSRCCRNDPWNILAVSAGARSVHPLSWYENQGKATQPKKHPPKNRNSLGNLFLFFLLILKENGGDSLHKLSRNCLRELCFCLGVFWGWVVSPSANTSKNGWGGGDPKLAVALRFEHSEKKASSEPLRTRNSNWTLLTSQGKITWIWKKKRSHRARNPEKFKVTKKWLWGS